MEYSLAARDSSSTTDYVIAQVRNLLQTGKLKPGDRLPTEFELAEQLNVSRGSVRSAMKVFDACGIIDIRRGDGTYVCSSIQEKTLLPLILSLYIMNPDFETMVQFRGTIELDILDLAMHSSEENRQQLIEELAVNLEKMKNVADNDAERGWQLDVEFHQIIANHCGNTLFQAIYSYITEFFVPLIQSSHTEQVHGNVAAKSHDQIYQSIVDKSFQLGKKAICESMDDWRELTKSFRGTEENTHKTMSLME